MWIGDVMKIRKIPFNDKDEIIQQYLNSLHGVIDDFQEDLIANADHYLMYDEGDLIGQIGVLKDAVTFFYIFEDVRYKQSRYFAQFIKAKNLGYAYASTADLNFFHTCIEHQKEMEMQAKFFLKTNQIPTAFDFSYVDYARMHDVEEIDLLTDHEFEDLGKRIQNGDVYSLKEEGELLGVGFISNSKMFPMQQTLGVFTKDKHRRKGVGSTLLEYMSEKIWKDGKKVIAGCYYYNEASSKMLSYSGFRLMNILVKFKLR